MRERHVSAVDAEAVYDGPHQTLGGNLIDENRTIITGEGGASPSRFNHVVNEGLMFMCCQVAIPHTILFHLQSGNNLFYFFCIYLK